MKIVSIVGARPQFVKVAPVHNELAKIASHEIIHTGQHYNDEMSASFFRDLEIPNPNVNLEVGSGSHASQTARILEALEAELIRLEPDWVIVYGDTNSTLAGALAAVKLQFKVAHLEAGLRSRNRRMPEEHNRVLTDHCADLCLAPTALAMDNLANEGLFSKSALVGDVMVDVLYATMRRMGVPEQREDRIHSREYLATIHRQENTEDPERLRQIVSALNALDKPVTVVAHPRLSARLASLPLSSRDAGNINFIEPLSYFDLIPHLASAPGLITDSGGLQKEAFLLGVPCVTLRGETEWIETIESGWNTLSEPTPDPIVKFLNGPLPPRPKKSPYGSGNAASRVAQELVANS